MKKVFKKTIPVSAFIIILLLLFASFSVNADSASYPVIQSEQESNNSTSFWACGRCGKYFSDEQGNNEIPENSRVLPKAIPESGDALIQMLENDPKFVWFTRNYAWRPLAQTGLSYDSSKSGTLLHMILQWPDLLGLSEYYPEAVGRPPRVDDFYVVDGPSIDEQGFREYANKYFNISDSAFNDFLQDCSQSRYIYYENGRIATGIAGWGTYEVILCGIQSAERDGNIYTVELYGRVPDNYTQSGFSWGKARSELDPAFTCTYRAVLEKKEANGQQWWSLHSISCVPPSGWVKSWSGTWYYYNGGYAATGWQLIGGKWYLFDYEGAMLTGWQKDGNTWYFMNPSGAMVTGWQQIGGTWYYFTGSGAMVTGWQVIGGTWYYFKSSGAMAANEWCGGYWLNANGSWTYQPKGSWKQNSVGWWFGDTSGWYARNTTIKIDGTWYWFNAAGYWG